MAQGHSQYDRELGSQSDLSSETILSMAVLPSCEGQSHSLGDGGRLRVLEALTALEARRSRSRSQQGWFVLGDSEGESFP